MVDLVFLLGHPFRPMFPFNSQDKEKTIGNDIVIKSKELNIEVKLLRNWKSATGCR